MRENDGALGKKGRKKFRRARRKMRCFMPDSRSQKKYNLRRVSRRETSRTIDHEFVFKNVERCVASCGSVLRAYAREYCRGGTRRAYCAYMHGELIYVHGIGECICTYACAGVYLITKIRCRYDTSCFVTRYMQGSIL